MMGCPNCRCEACVAEALAWFRAEAGKHRDPRDREEAYARLANAYLLEGSKPLGPDLEQEDLFGERNR